MMLDIGRKRQFAWDDFPFDLQKTTADRRVHSPIRRENVFRFDCPWEGDGCDYFNTVYDVVRNVWRMYYLAWEMLNGEKKLHSGFHIKVCCIESADGIHWERPDLGIVEFEGSVHNNIVIVQDMFPGLLSIDNFFVTVDTNPSPSVEGIYKAVMAFPEKNEDGTTDRKLMALASDDGYHFHKVGVVTREGFFDTLNTVMWHNPTKRYICYIRSFHEKDTMKEYSGESGVDLNRYVRDIRVLYSEDFVNWTDPQRIRFGNGEDQPLYTNAVSPYPGAEHMLVGFPTRYVERMNWTSNFDRLCGREKREERCRLHPRYGLATTDCIFMCSRDGLNWKRYDEAFIRPGPEFPENWVYGSCYPNTGWIETPALVPGADAEWNMYCFDNHWMSEPTVLYRMTIRKDGYVSFSAGIEKKRVVTRPFVLGGSHLKINFSTSARGGMTVKIVSEEDGTQFESDELFGDRVNRTVDFIGDLSLLKGKPVHLEFEMCDMDLFAFQFE